ncbi:ATP-binding protein [Candidatus Woesearchaeota archaeon]|nr:ATP-binding protein [Candidatus Woesearchaeota archaeon]
MYNLTNSNYGMDMKKLYLDNAESYLLKSKLDLNREKEYVQRAEEMIDRAKTINIQEKQNVIGNFLFTKPKFTFRDVAGMEEVKDKIKIKVVEPINNPEIFQIFGKKFGGGMIMYGPPGCGKSYIAEATAGEADVTYFNVKVSDIKGKYVGETENNLAKLFKLAREHQPCIIFFDEFESLGRERNDAVGHDKSMVSQLLTEIDSLGSKNQQIMLIAATNEPWNIDIAFRREGRFGNTIFIPPPDHNSRKNILKMQLQGKPIDEKLNYEELAKITELYSGADLLEVCNTAVENVISECLKNKKIRKITTEDILEVIKKKKELVSAKWLKKSLETIYTTNNEDSFREVIEYANKYMNKEMD